MDNKIANMRELKLKKLKTQKARVRNYSQNVNNSINVTIRSENI